MSLRSNSPSVKEIFNVFRSSLDERTYSNVLFWLLYFQLLHDRAFVIPLIVMSLLQANPYFALLILKLIISTLLFIFSLSLIFKLAFLSASIM